MTAPGSAWSRRKAAVAAEAEAEGRALEDAAVVQKHAELAEKSDEEVLAELGLPDPDSLSMGDDFKGFLSKAVPDHIRKRALRKLWRSNPVLACVDGLNDYDDDYLTGSTGQGAIKTAYQVGKGMLAHVLEVERQKEAKAAPTEPELVEECAEVDEGIAAAEVPVSDEPETEALAGDDGPDDVGIAEAPIVRQPRRMQFQSQDGPL